MHLASSTCGDNRMWPGYRKSNETCRVSHANPHAWSQSCSFLNEHSIHPAPSNEHTTLCPLPTFHLDLRVINLNASVQSPSWRNRGISLPRYYVRRTNDCIVVSRWGTLRARRGRRRDIITRMSFPHGCGFGPLALYATLNTV